MNYWDTCPRCGKPPKPLVCSWYCPCEDDGLSLLGFAVVNNLLLEEFPEEGLVPRGTSLFIFKKREEAADMYNAFLGYTLIRVDLSLEGLIFWSQGTDLISHEVSRNLPYEVLQ